MVNPADITREIKQLHREDMTLGSVVDILSRKYDIREEDVRVMAVTTITDWYDEWEPSMRKRRKKS